MSKTEENNLTIVFYIDVRSLESQDQISDYIGKISKRATSSLKGEQIFIPIYGETRVECINPIYITDSELIKKHERLMAELHEHLNNQLDDKEKNN